MQRSVVWTDASPQKKLNLFQYAASGVAQARTSSQIMRPSAFNYIHSRLIEQTTWLNASDPAPEKRISVIDHPTAS